MFHIFSIFYSSTRKYPIIWFCIEKSKISTLSIFYKSSCCMNKSIFCCLIISIIGILNFKFYSYCWVLSFLISFIYFSIRKRSCTTRTIPLYFKSFINKILIVHIFECPNYRLHKSQVHSIISMIHICPSSYIIYKNFPFITSRTNVFSTFFNKFFYTNFLFNIFFPINT